MSEYDAIPIHPLVRRFGYFVEGLFLLMVLFGPWAFGTTQYWSIYTLCIASGVFFISSVFLLWMDKHFSSRFQTEGSSRNRHWWNWIDWVFCLVAILCLVYVFVQWWNAQYVYLVDSYELYPLPHNESLPSSFDKPYTLFYLIQYTALFCAYLGSRFLFHIGQKYHLHTMERFLWIALTSTFIMVIVGALMRLDKTTSILWIAERSQYAGTNNSFGPYGYRSTAAQYMNLLWPIGIAFWWSIRSRLERHGVPFHRTFFNKYIVLAVMSFFIFAGVWIAISRGGVWIGSAIGVLLIVAILFDALRGRKKNITLVLCILILVGGAVTLGLKIAGKDALRLTDPESEARIQMYEESWPIYHDYSTYGIGAGAFPTVYSMYAGENQKIVFSLHSDWMQLLIEFGIVGASCVVFLLLWGLILPWITRRGQPFFRIAMILAFSTALVHAVVDLPFYVLSVSWLFVVLMAFYHSLMRQKRSSRKRVIEE